MKYDATLLNIETYDDPDIDAAANKADDIVSDIDISKQNTVTKKIKRENVVYAANFEEVKY